MRALEKLGVASLAEIWRVAAQIDPFITLRDVSFELYHGTRDSKNPVYKKTGRGKYALLDLAGSEAKYATPEEMKKRLDRLREQDA